MKPFMDADFLLTTDAARRLYHDHAEKMPVVDYHCHIDPAEIATDRRYDNISQVWLGGDHYKWRLIRANGTPEREITGARESEPALLFRRFAAALPKAAGNPVFHWTYLELKRYFGVDTPLNEATADEIYALCNQKLAGPELSVRGMIARYDVRLICTTDDPADDLRWHRQIKEDPTCAVQVLPAMRPDKAMNLAAPGYAEYLAALGQAAGVSINSFAALSQALENRVEFFQAMGCRASDHGLDAVACRAASAAQLEAIFQKAAGGRPVTPEEAEQYRTALLLKLAGWYARHGWVMQLHFGARRNNDTTMYDKLGPDTGFDSMNGDGRPGNLAPLMDAMRQNGALPRMVLYSLNAHESETVASIAGCFMADAECPGKIQLGSAWWFTDTKTGMEKQLQDYANSTLLGNFIGMLTDSRSFLSYTRHEYFRRILCNFLGRLMENGEYPADFAAAGRMVEDISYNNTVRFFGFEL